MKKNLLLIFIFIIIGCDNNTEKTKTDTCSTETLNISPTKLREFVDSLNTVSIKSNPIQKTWYKYSPNVDSNIVYKDNLFIAFVHPEGTGSKVLPTEGSTISYSEDGLNWIHIDEKLSGVYTKIITVDDYYYAIGYPIENSYNSTIIRSKNGYEWESVFSVKSTKIQDIEYVDNKIIAVGTHGLVAFSEDGIDWEKRKLCEYSFYDITTSSNEIVISGDPGVILSSTNGESWNLIKHDIEAVGVRDGIYANERYLFSTNDTILIYDKNFLPLKKSTNMHQIGVYENSFLSLGEDVMLSDNAEIWTKIAKVEKLDVHTTEVDLTNFIIVNSEIIFPN
ncbi:MAG TPA: hypothetical protein ENK86_02280 [Campylobacterales bacterium]|nr:hypothetical protein [Campylobacterales bacterium]